MPSRIYLLFKAVGNGSGYKRVDDTNYVQTSDGTGVFDGLTLGSVEATRDRNDSVGHSGVQVSFCCFLHLGKNHRHYFFMRDGFSFLLAGNFDFGQGAVAEGCDQPRILVQLNSWIAEPASDHTRHCQRK